MDTNQPRPAAVYQRGLGYSDENTTITVHKPLEDLLTRWRAGEEVEIAEAWAEHNDSDADPDTVVSIHDTIDQALAKAHSDHIQLCAQLTFVGMGFDNFGCVVDVSPYNPDDSTSYDQDMPRLRQWCSDNGVAMPTSLDPSDPEVMKRCVAIANRSMEGDLWLDFFQDGPQAAAPFAADMVADDLRAAGKPELAADLFSFLLCDLTYVGPPPPSQPPQDKPGPGRPERKGFLGRLFGK